MKPHRSLAGLALALAACGCTSPAPKATVVGYISDAVLTPAQKAGVISICGDAGPLLSAAVASHNATISGTAVDANAYCKAVGTAPAGSLPITTDANTPSWLPAVISAIRIAADLAREVLPKQIENQ